MQNLENEFLKRKSTSTLIDKHYEKYPFLRDIICFPSGLQVILMQIASFVSRCHENIQPTTAEKILNASECKEITAANILLSENGLSCQIVCPVCNKQKKLSSCSADSGAISFSVHNFDRHYKKCKEDTKNNSSNVLTETGQNSTEISEGISCY